MALTEPIRDPAKVKELLAYYRDLRHFRNQLIITLAIHTALRISDEDVKHKTKKYIAFLLQDFAAKENSVHRCQRTLCLCSCLLNYYIPSAKLANRHRISTWLFGKTRTFSTKALTTSLGVAVLLKAFFARDSAFLFALLSRSACL